MEPFRSTAFRLAVAASLLGCSSSIAQSGVVNGDFDSGLEGWEFPDAMPTWSPFDAGGSTQSGSAYGIHPGGENRNCVLRQCIALPDSGRRVLSVQVYTPPGQGAGNLVLSYSARYNAPACTGGSFAVGGRYLPSIGAWTHHAVSFPVEAVPHPPGTTVEVQLCLDAPAQGPFDGYFDRIQLHHDLLLRSGFE